MAKKTVLQIVDDIDGAELNEYETVRWGLDGKNYEFDTSPEHAEEFRNHMAKYTSASRTTKGRAKASIRDSRTTKGNLEVIRKWARENGHEVADRGRISGKIVEAYNKATA